MGSNIGSVGIEAGDAITFATVYLSLLGNQRCSSFQTATTTDKTWQVRQMLVKWEDGVLGEVEDHWFRFEGQGRGSLHLHVLLWLKKVPLEEGEGTQGTPGTQDSFADERGDLHQSCAG